MSTETVVRGFIQALNSHDRDEISGRVSVDFVNEHTSTTGTSLVGRVAYRERLAGFLADFEDLTYTVEDVIAQQDRAAVAYTMSFRLVSAGGAPVTVRGVFRFRVDADGLIAHRVDYWDSGQVQRQLDAAPPSPG
jgi:ketosteroid isomerase-like protein